MRVIILVCCGIFVGLTLSTVQQANCRLQQIPALSPTGDESNLSWHCTPCPSGENCVWQKQCALNMHFPRLCYSLRVLLLWNTGCSTAVQNIKDVFHLFNDCNLSVNLHDRSKNTALAGQGLITAWQQESYLVIYFGFEFCYALIIMKNLLLLHPFGAFLCLLRLFK